MKKPERGDGEIMEQAKNILFGYFGVENSERGLSERLHWPLEKDEDRTVPITGNDVLAGYTSKQHYEEHKRAIQDSNWCSRGQNHWLMLSAAMFSATPENIQEHILS